MGSATNYLRQAKPGCANSEPSRQACAERRHTLTAADTEDELEGIPFARALLRLVRLFWPWGLILAVVGGGLCLWISAQDARRLAIERERAATRATAAYYSHEMAAERTAGGLGDDYGPYSAVRRAHGALTGFEILRAQDVGYGLVWVFVRAVHARSVVLERCAVTVRSEDDQTADDNAQVVNVQDCQRLRIQSNARGVGPAAAGGHMGQ